MRRVLSVVMLVFLALVVASPTFAQEGGEGTESVEPGIESAGVSTSPDGESMTELPAGLESVYVTFRYLDMQGEQIQVRTYNYRGEVIRIEEAPYTGSGTETMEIPFNDTYLAGEDDTVYPEGRYMTNLYIDGNPVRTLIWEVGEVPEEQEDQLQPTVPAASQQPTAVANQVQDPATSPPTTNSPASGGFPFELAGAGASLLILLFVVIWGLRSGYIGGTS